MMQCPTCKRKLATGIYTCPRCSTDLALLHRLTDQAEKELKRGQVLLKRQKPKKALQAFYQAGRLQQSEKSQAGMAAALLCNGNFKAALTCFFQWKNRV